MEAISKRGSFISAKEVKSKKVLWEGNPNIVLYTLHKTILVPLIILTVIDFALLESTACKWILYISLILYCISSMVEVLSIKYLITESSLIVRHLGFYYEIMWVEMDWYSAPKLLITKGRPSILFAEPQEIGNGKKDFEKLALLWYIDDYSKVLSIISEIRKDFVLSDLDEM